MTELSTPGWVGQASMSRHVVTSAVAWTKIVEANDRRIALALSGATGEVLFYSFDDSFALDHGLRVPAGAGPVVLSRLLHGGLVTRAWFVAGSVGGNDVHAVEAFA